MPLVTVIVPVYNVEKYLAECLDSICAQTLKNIEIICMNDGSTDLSGDILAQYAARDSRIFVLNQENQGQSAARNNALDLARGKYISFVDSDDIIAPEMLEELYNRAEALNADIAFGNRVIYYQDENKKDVIPFWRKLKADNTVEEDDNLPETFKAERIYDYMLITPCYPWGKLIRREFLTNHNIKFVKGLIYEDIIYFVDLMMAKPVMTYLNKPFYTYRVLSTSTCRKVSAKQFDIFKVIKHIAATIKANALEQRLNRNLYYLTNYDLTHNYHVIPEDRRAEYCKRVEKYLTSKTTTVFSAGRRTLKSLTLAFAVSNCRKRKNNLHLKQIQYRRAFSQNRRFFLLACTIKCY